MLIVCFIFSSSFAKHLCFVSLLLLLLLLMIYILLKKSKNALFLKVKHCLPPSHIFTNIQTDLTRARSMRSNNGTKTHIPLSLVQLAAATVNTQFYCFVCFAALLTKVNMCVCFCFVYILLAFFVLCVCILLLSYLVCVCCSFISSTFPSFVVCCIFSFGFSFLFNSLLLFPVLFSMPFHCIILFTSDITQVDTHGTQNK